MANIPISNFINISIAQASQGIPAVNINNIVIFTDETPIETLNGDFATYSNPSSVGLDWGTTSEVFAQATAIFAQTPNILSGTGQLIIVPLITSVSATAGTFTTPDIFVNLVNFLPITDGGLSISIDGSPFLDILLLNFTAASTLADIAGILDVSILGTTVTTFNGKILFTSDTTGIASEIALASPSSGTDITTATFLNIIEGVTLNGIAGGSEELIVDAILRTQEQVFYGGILATIDLTSQISTLAPFMQSIDKLLFFPSADVTELEVGSPFFLIQQANETHTRCLYYGEGTQEARIMASAYASRGMSVNFNAVDSTLTMQYKDLLTIAGDSTLNETLYQQGLVVGADMYALIGGVPKVTTSLANQPFDEVYNLLAYKFDLEFSFLNILATTSTKIPQTEEGINILLNAGRKVSAKFVANGFLAPGTWLSPDTVGNPEDLKRNIEEFGYYWVSQPINQQTPAEREARIAPLISNASKSAGAIHTIIINILFES